MNEAILHTDGITYVLNDDLRLMGVKLHEVLIGLWSGRVKGDIDDWIVKRYLVPLEATADDCVRAIQRVADTVLSPSDAKHREQCKVDFSQIENFAHHPKHVPSVITQKLIDQLLERDAHGKAKYGATLDRNDLTLADWLQHMAEELMDGAGYALAAKRELLRLASVDKAAYDLVKAMNALDPVGQLRAMQVLKDIVMSANGT